MKKSCAMKLIAFALVAIMMMSTAIGAMAASITSTVRYSGETNANVRTQVTGLTDETMVTYMVTDGTEIAATGDSNIDYIDQKNVVGGAAEFGFTSTQTAVGTQKIFVGADTWAAPQGSTANVVANGATVQENGVMITGSSIPEENMNLIADADTTTAIKLVHGTADDVAYVAVDGTSVQFVRGAPNTIYVTCALTADSIISVGYYAPFVSAAQIYDATETVTEGTHYKKGYGFTTGHYAHIQVDVINANVTDITVGDAENGGGSERKYNDGQDLNVYNEGMAGWQKTTKDLEIAIPYNTALRSKIIAGIQEGGSSKFGGETYYTGSAGSVETKTAQELTLSKWIVDGIVADENATGIANCVYPAGSSAAILLSKDGGSFDVTLNVKVAGTYTVATRVGAYSAQRKPKITVNGTAYDTTMVTTVTTGGTIATADIPLAAGDNVLTISAADTVNGPVRFDSIVALAKDSVGDAVLDAMKTEVSYQQSGIPNALNQIIDTGLADVSVSLGKVVTGTDAEGNTTVTAFARALGYYHACGIKFGETQYPAMQASGNEADAAKGAFAIELYGSADEMSGLNGATVQAYADSVLSPGTKTLNLSE